MILTILVGLAILAVWGCCTFAVGFGCGTYVGRWVGVELEAAQHARSRVNVKDAARLRRVIEILSRTRTGAKGEADRIYMELLRVFQ